MSNDSINIDPAELQKQIAEQAAKLVAQAQIAAAQAQAPAQAIVPAQAPAPAQANFGIVPDVLSDTERELFASLSVSRSTSTITLVPHTMVQFDTEAVHPARLDANDQPIKYSRGFMAVNEIKLVEVSFREQDYAEENKRFGQKFNVLECTFAVPGAMFGWMDGDTPRQIDVFGPGETRSPLIYTQTVGVTDHDAVKALRDLLTADVVQFNPQTGDRVFVRKGWSEPNFGNASASVHGESDMSQPRSSTTLWRIGPNTDATSYRAHLPRAIEQGIPVDSVQLRENNLTMSSDAIRYTDPLSGVFMGLAADLIDGEPGSAVQQALESGKMPAKDNPKGKLRTSVTGMTRVRGANKAPNPLGRRVPLRADMPELTVEGRAFSFWLPIEGTSGVTTTDQAPA